MAALFIYKIKAIKLIYLLLIKNWCKVKCQSELVEDISCNSTSTGTV
jgi:hypothetical protein